MSRFQFVADNSATFEVKRLCELVEIERSSYYAWLKGAPARTARAAADAALAERIRTIHGADNTVGAPRVAAELNDGVPAAERVNHKRVARVMRCIGIAGYVKKRRVRTTIFEQTDQKVPDLLKRDFTAPAPNRRYVGDITYLPLADGSNLYLATVVRHQQILEELVHGAEHHLGSLRDLQHRRRLAPYSAVEVGQTDAHLGRADVGDQHHASGAVEVEPVRWTTAGGHLALAAHDQPGAHQLPRAGLRRRRVECRPCGGGAGRRALMSSLELTHAMGGTILTGALYSALDKYGAPLTEAGRANVVGVLRRLASEAAQRGMILGLEICNRYETNVINTAHDAV